jgi:hypothetical protein
LLSELASIAAMQYFVLLAGIAFRVSDTADLKIALSKFVFFDFDFGLANIGLGAISFFSSLLIMTAFAALHIASRRVGQLDYFLVRASLGWACVTCIIVGFTACLLWPMSDIPFIYFQF